MAIFDKHSTLGYSTVATAPSPSSTGTSLTIQSGDGTKFPAVPFNTTVWPAGTIPTLANAEVVRVTTVATDTFTIVRHQEGTSARSIVVGDQIGNTVTVKTLTDLENLYSLTTQTTDYAALTTDSTILADASSANITVTLPTAVGVTGKVYTVKKIDSTTHTVTVATSSSQTIDGVLTKVITGQYTSLSMVSDGANWNIV